MKARIVPTVNIFITSMLLVPLLLGFAGPASAAESSPPPPHALYTAAPQSANGFSYIWSVEAFNPDLEVPVETGIPSNLIHPGGNATLPLPFSFEFYGETYTTIHVAEHGYISFESRSSWPSQGEIPSTAEPNNIVAPFWSPIDTGNTPYNKWVRYKAFGDAPNRYFIVQWYRVQDPDRENSYNFLVVLHENGDIVFQYNTMTFRASSTDCGTAGIEDKTGANGVATIEGCDQPVSGTAVRLTPVAAPLNVDAQIQAPDFVLGTAESIARVTAVYGNYGLTTAESVVVTATLDHNLSLQNALPVPNSLGGHILVWDLEDLPYLSTGQINLDLKLPSAVVGNRYPITWTLSSAGPEEYPDDNSDLTEIIIAKPTFLPLILRNH